MSRLVGWIFLLSFLGACASNPATAPMGSEGAECYPNSTCNQGLVCASRRCVVLPGSDGSVIAGDGPTSGDLGGGIDSPVMPGDQGVADMPTRPDVPVTTADSGVRCTPACAADEICTAAGCVTSSTGGEGPANGGAIDEDPGGGGTTACDAPTTAQMVSGVWWLPQSPPGSWGGTVNCGQTSVTMLNGFLSRTAPTSANITAVDEWIQAAGLGSTNSGNGTRATTVVGVGYKLHHAAAPPPPPPPPPGGGGARARAWRSLTVRAKNSRILVGRALRPASPDRSAHHQTPNQRGVHQPGRRAPQHRPAQHRCW